MLQVLSTNPYLPKRTTAMAPAYRELNSTVRFHLWLIDSSDYRSIDLGPGDVPFELRPSPGKGWGAFATRTMAPGELVFDEKPLFVIQKPTKHITEFNVRAAFRQLSPREKQQFL